MSHIIDYEPSSYEEVANQQAGRDAMMEEYQSIMKNGGVSIHHEEWCVGCCFETLWEVCGDLQMDLQDQEWSRWKLKKSPAMHTNIIG